jgi:hypothetical protein
VAKGDKNEKSIRTTGLGYGNKFDVFKSCLKKYIFNSV